MGANSKLGLFAIQKEEEENREREKRPILCFRSRESVGNIDIGITQVKKKSITKNALSQMHCSLHCAFELQKCFVFLPFFTKVPKLSAFVGIF